MPIGMPCNKILQMIRKEYALNLFVRQWLRRKWWATKALPPLSSLRVPQLEALQGTLKVPSLIFLEMSSLGMEKIAGNGITQGHCTLSLSQDLGTDCVLLVSILSGTQIWLLSWLSTHASAMKEACQHELSPFACKELLLHFCWRLRSLRGLAQWSGKARLSWIFWCKIAVAWAWSGTQTKSCSWMKS